MRDHSDYVLPCILDFISGIIMCCSDYNYSYSYCGNSLNVFP
jgi:hypothetical protein